MTTDKKPQNSGQSESNAKILYVMIESTATSIHLNSELQIHLIDEKNFLFPTVKKDILLSFLSKTCS